MYLIIRKSEGWPPLYLGAIDINGPFCYFVTGQSGPTIFNDVKEAQRECHHLKSIYPQGDFEVLPVSVYLAKLKKDGRMIGGEPGHKPSFEIPEWLQKIIDQYK